MTKDGFMGKETNMELLNFIVPSNEVLHILVVESLEFLGPLRELLPDAELYAVTADADESTELEYKGLGVHWTIADYLSEPLPFKHESFDYLLSEHCLDMAGNPQDIAGGFGLFLKPTGYLLTSFFNIRYWRIIKNMMEGHFYHVCSRAYSKNEMYSLLGASFYKDAILIPQISRAPRDFVDRLEQAGFENFNDDLETETWLVKAAKSAPDVLELKRLFTPEVRHQLVTLLRRMEYGIEIHKNGAALKQLVEDQGIFAAYVAAFAFQTIVHTEIFLRSILSAGYSLGWREWTGELLEEMASVYDEHKDYQVVLDYMRNGLTEEAERECEDKCILEANDDIAFITCVSNEALYSECLLFLKRLSLPKGMRAEYIGIRGASSMCQGYNEGMKRTNARYKVYLHQDTLIVNKNFVYDVIKLFSDVTIGALGVIGCRNLPASGVWWDGLRTYGRVLHACEAESTVDSICSEPQDEYIEAEAVDGLLFATQHDTAWREDLFDGWHFYEIAQSQELSQRGYKTIIPRQKSFWCIHSPKEKPLEISYKRYQKIFLREYGHRLEPEV